jgi:hypothetical protein
MEPQMKLRFDPAMVLLTLAIASPAVAADEEWKPMRTRRAYLIAPSVEPAFSWPPDKVARRARADTLVWRSKVPVAPAASLRRSSLDPALLLERP